MALANFAINCTNARLLLLLPSSYGAEGLLSGESMPGQTPVGLLGVLEAHVPDVELPVAQDGVAATWNHG